MKDFGVQIHLGNSALDKNKHVLPSLPSLQDFLWSLVCSHVQGNSKVQDRDGDRFAGSPKVIYIFTLFILKKYPEGQCSPKYTLRNAGRTITFLELEYSWGNISQS